jgi:signal transduction histidine kinase
VVTVGLKRPVGDLFGVVGLLAAVTTTVVWTSEGPAPVLRYFYLIPILWGAVRFGWLGGMLSSLMAVLLYAPFVLPAVESKGMASGTLDGLVTFGIFLVLGSLAGTLAQRAQAESARYHTLLALQRVLFGGGELRAILFAAVEELKLALGAREVSLLILSPGEVPLVVSRTDELPSPASFEPNGEFRHDSAAGWVLREGRSLFIADLETDPRFRLPSAAGLGLRPRRLFLVPLQAREGCVGVMAVEREGEFPGADRTAMETLGLQLALGIENARLAARQRRFALELEEKVAAATRGLRELDQAKSDFLSIVSHELRTPLTSLQGFSELLLTRPSSPERTRQFLGYIHQEAERLGRIVGDLLDLSRIELGRGIELRQAPLTLGPLLEANGEQFRAQTTCHQLTWEVPLDLPQVLADRDALNQVIKNLLSNALKYSPGGGAVRLWAARSDRDPGMVEIGVSDQGVGIPREMISRIFEKYYRVSHPDTAQVRGLGIGLALVKHLIEAQGGSIRVESREGQGSCFTVALPMAPESPARTGL